MATLNLLHKKYKYVTKHIQYYFSKVKKPQILSCNPENSVFKCCG